MRYSEYFFRGLLTLAFVCLMLGRCNAQTVDHPRQHPLQDARSAGPGSPILFLPVGASSNDESVRRIGWGIPTNGWYNSVIDKRIDAWATEFQKRGLPFRIMLHNPWGTPSGEVMDFDQAVEARQNPKLQLACQTFPKWLETRLRPLLGERGECIIYLGSGRRDKDFQGLEPAAYIDRLNQSLRDVPIWCSIAFDDAGELTDDHPFSDFIRLQSEIRRIYIEPRPIKGGSSVGYSVICDSQLWDRSNPAKYPDAQHMAANSKSGEIVRFSIRGGDELRDQRKKWLQRALDEGHTMMFSYTDIQWALDLKPKGEK